MQQSLRTHTGERLNELLLDPLLRQVSVFGFHLQTLDIRQHARVHASAVDELSNAKTASVGNQARLPASVSAETRELLDVLRTVAELKREFPAQAIGSYVVSGASKVEDILSVIWLARLCVVRVEASA